MSLTRSAERAALNKLIDYLDDNPQENIDKIMDLVNKLVPNRVFPVQREAFTNVIKSRGNWYDLIMRVFSLNPQMRTKLLKTLIVDANLLAWPEADFQAVEQAITERSEERRVGKECSEPCRSRWSPYH